MDLPYIDADKVQATWAYLTQFAVSQGLNCLAALAILIAGWWLSGRAARAVRQGLHHTHVDDTLRPMLASVAQWVVRVLTVVLVLSQFGVQTASIIAMLGAAGLAIGLALQGTLQNIAAGIMLVLLRRSAWASTSTPRACAGTVRETGLFMTELTTFDGVCLRVPNGKLWGSSIMNYSENVTRRMDIEIAVTFDSPVQAGLDALKAMLAKEPGCWPSPGRGHGDEVHRPRHCAERALLDLERRFLERAVRLLQQAEADARGRRLPDYRAGAGSPRAGDR